MPRKVFYSVRYQSDSWRASEIRNIGTVDGNPSLIDNTLKK